MDAIYSATALRDKPKEVKRAAQEGLVRITENGTGAYVFCSEEVYRREIEAAREQAFYEYRVADAIERGTRDIKNGDYVVGIEAGKKALAERRASRG